MIDRNKGATRRREATIKDVALEAGVSPSTVSRVINQQGPVKPSTIDRIRKAIVKVDYRPNVGARRLSGGRTYQLLMFFNNPNVSWTAEFLIGTIQACHRIGYHLTIEGVGGFEGDAACTTIDYPDIAVMLDQASVDGIILPPPICFDTQLLDIIRERGIPCVRIAGTPARGMPLRVSIDNYSGAYRITEFLIGLGHENIAVIKGPADYVASALRFEGFAAAMRDRGLQLPDNYIQSGQFDAQSGNQCAHRLLRQANRPTAIFASNDEMAAGALGAAQESAIRVPDELSIVGFDDAPIARSVWPKLTTIHQPLRSMGDAAVALLDQSLRQHGETPGDGFRPDVLLNFELRERQSTAPAPAQIG